MLGTELNILQGQQTFLLLRHIEIGLQIFFVLVLHKDNGETLVYSNRVVGFGQWKVLESRR